MLALMHLALSVLARDVVLEHTRVFHRHEYSESCKIDNLPGTQIVIARLELITYHLVNDPTRRRILNHSLVYGPCDTTTEL